MKKNKDDASLLCVSWQFRKKSQRERKWKLRGKEMEMTFLLIKERPLLASYR